MWAIGHRGARGHAPENTLESIERAMTLGACHVEIDVHSVEGRLVVIHDDRLERTTDGTGAVAERSLDYVRGLDAGNGQRVPLLDEVFSLVRGRAALNVELKGEGTVEPFLGWIASARHAGLEDDTCLVSSFDSEKLFRLRATDSQIRLGVLLRSGKEPFRVAAALDAYSVHPPMDVVSESLIAGAHERGYKAFVFTVNEEPDLRRMKSWGADGVFTDYPDRVPPSGARSPRWT